METPVRRRAMARLEDCAEGDGKTLGANLLRLGVARIDVAKVAKLVQEMGEPMSPQRVSALLHSPKFSEATFEKIARALGVDPSELTRPLPPPPPRPSPGSRKGKG